MEIQGRKTAKGQQAHPSQHTLRWKWGSECVLETVAKDEQGEILAFMKNKFNSRPLKGEQGQSVPKPLSVVSQFQDGYNQILVFKLVSKKK